MIRFLLKVVVVSVPLTLIWMNWGRQFYASIFPYLASPIYGWLGLTSVMPNADRERFINFLPFVVLMLVTPKMSITRRVVGTLVGCVLIFFCHLLFVWIHQISTLSDNRGMTTEGFSQFFPVMLLSDAFPFILWVVIANEFVREGAARLFVQKKGSQASAKPPGKG